MEGNSKCDDEKSPRVIVSFVLPSSSANHRSRSGKGEFVGFDNLRHKSYLPQNFPQERKGIGACNLRVSFPSISISTVAFTPLTPTLLCGHLVLQVKCSDDDWCVANNSIICYLERCSSSFQQICSVASDCAAFVRDDLLGPMTECLKVSDGFMTDMMASVRPCCHLACH